MNNYNYIEQIYYHFTNQHIELKNIIGSPNNFDFKFSNGFGHFRKQSKYMAVILNFENDKNEIDYSFFHFVTAKHGNLYLEEYRAIFDGKHTFHKELIFKLEIECNDNIEQFPDDINIYNFFDQKKKKIGKK